MKSELFSAIIKAYGVLIITQQSGHNNVVGNFHVRNSYYFVWQWKVYEKCADEKSFHLIVGEVNSTQWRVFNSQLLYTFDVDVN